MRIIIKNIRKYKFKMYSSRESPTSQNVITKEISRGIFLHRQQHVREENDGIEIIYMYKVEVRTLQVIEFTADFSDSENLMLENHNELIVTTSIQPFSSEVVAILRLLRNWKLKSKFRFVMHSPPIDYQRKYLLKYWSNLREEINTALDKIGMIPTAVISIPEITMQLKRHEMRFIDPDFLPIDFSLYGTKDSPYDTLVQWRRPEEFMAIPPDSYPVLYNSAIEVSDIKEGALGDGWFVSAVATLAEIPPLIDRLFISKEVNKVGVYRVRLCMNGEWVQVTVDDYFPCIPDGGPIFSKSSPNELWVLILEKAYAKSYGSYLTLKGGYAHEALLDLTGCPCIYYNFEDEFVKEMIKAGSLWRKIKDADEKGYLMSGSTAGEERWADTPTGDREDNLLLPGHSYTIVGLAEIQKYKLIRLKNIWSQFEW